MRSLTERHQYILDQVQRNGSVTVLDLCKELEVCYGVRPL